MIAYASRTGTKRNLEALKSHGWRLFVVPPDGLRTEGFRHYALDNGAWGAYQKKTAWDADLYVRALAELGRPDIVGGGQASLSLSLSWVSRVRAHCSLALLPVQDGMTVADVRPHVGERIGIFIGGTTEWKLSTIPMWGAFAKSEDLWLHVGRVNSARRIRACSLAGATSFDGTSVSRYAKTIGKLDHARRQPALEGIT